MARKIGIGLAVVAALLALQWWWVGGSVGLVAGALPDFPDWPEPPERLQAGDAGRLHFASLTPYDFDVILGGLEAAVPTTGVGTLVLPGGASADAPVPAVVLLHGSGGITPGREMDYAELLAEAGYAVFALDYYAPRGVDPVHDYMVKVVAVTEFDAVADAYGALRLLGTHPAIDGERVALAGFSYGGMAARIAMDERVREALAPESAGFSAFVDVYGPCFQKLGTQRTNGAPLLTLRGTEDASNELPVCLRREDELRALGVEVEAHVFEGAGHAWENDAPRALREDAPYLAGCEIAYDASGWAHVDGRPLAQLEPTSSRPERVTARLIQGRPLGACVKSGYVIGSDPATKQRANALLLGFLGRTLVR